MKISILILSFKRDGDIYTMLSKVDKLKYEISNKQMFDKCENNVYNLIQYNKGVINNFPLFNYIISCGDICEYPISLLSLFSMFNKDGSPMTDKDVVYSNYKRIIFGNSKIKYLRDYIDSFSNEELNLFFHIYSELWQYSDLLRQILHISYCPQLLYHYIYNNKLNQFLKFTLNSDETLKIQYSPKSHPHTIKMSIHV